MERLKGSNSLIGEWDLDSNARARILADARERGVRSPSDPEYEGFPLKVRDLFAYIDSLYEAEILGVHDARGKTRHSRRYIY